MKKSNKILLGGLLTIILVLVAVHVALYARYKAGHFVPFNERMAEEATIVEEFPNAKAIQIRYLTNVVLRVGDRFKVEQYGESRGHIQLSEQGGSVELSLKDSVGSEHIFDQVIVYVPEKSTITTHKASVTVEGENGKKIGHLNFRASGGYVGFRQSKNMLQIDSLNVEAMNQANIQFQNVQVGKLAIQLNASELTDLSSVFQTIYLNADSTSRISLQAKNLSNIIPKTTAHE